MDGVQLLEYIKDKNPFEPPVVLISGYSDMNQEMALAKGAAGFIKKPMSIENLLKVVHEVLQESPRFQRKYERIHIKQEIKLDMKALGESVPPQALSIGQGGMFIKTENFGKVGDLLQFEITLPEKEVVTISGVGEIVWQRVSSQGNYPPGIGMKFINLPPETLKFIENFVRVQRTRAFIPCC
jgi:Tfp pilus assembly protein PilZ